jgi:hypothetical protein
MTAALLAVILAARHGVQDSDPSVILEPNKPPTSVLPLPPVGAELGIFGKWERGNLAPGKEPILEAKAGDVQIKQFTVTKVDDPYGGRGMLQVDVILNKAARDHYVDLYVSGYYVGVFGEVEGVKNVGRRPAYEFMRVDYAAQNKHPGKEPNRRYSFRIPDVLPAKVRAELYQIPLGKQARFLGKKEAGFDADWKDYGVVEGHLFGDLKKAVTKASFFVLPGTESVSVRVPALKPIKPDDFSNDLSISLRAQGRTEIVEPVNRNIEGREFNWKATSISSSPGLQDRDIRNSEYWPFLKGAGYLEIPPIKAGNASITKYP